MRLLSPRPFADYTAVEYGQYVRSLYVAPPVSKPPAEYSVRLNGKGTPVLTVRRSPRWLTSGEVGEIAQEIGWSLQQFWLHVLKKKIIISIPKKEKTNAKRRTASTN